MKKIAKFLMLWIVCILFLPIHGAAATVSTEDIKIQLSTDKEEYSKGEHVKVTLDVKNTSEEPMMNILISTSLPENYYFKGSAKKIIYSLEAAESDSVPIELLAETTEKDGSGETVTNEDPEDDAKDNSENDSKTEDIIETKDTVNAINAVPKETGDQSKILLWSVVLVSSGTVFVALAVYQKKRIRKLLSILLCFALMGGSLADISVHAATEKETKSVKITENVTIDGEKTEIIITVEYEWKDTDEEIPMVSKEIAALYGIDPYDYDTDNDGLSNYIEIYVSQTNPTLVDSDKDGVNDPDEDFDGDKLSNIKEIELGTSLDKQDTDKDGLNDYDEVTTYLTDPTLYDTDGDSLSDGDEIYLGLDPLKKMSDGKTPDAEREFAQKLDENNIAEQLLDESNEAVPSLELTVSGNVNKQVVVNEDTSVYFGDSRAVVGSAIEVQGENVSAGTLTFSLKESSVSMLSLEDTEEFISTNMICRYNEDGTTEFLDTEYDAQTSSISAEIENGGTYFVLNVETMFHELGLRMPEISNVEQLEDPEQTVTLPEEKDQLSVQYEESETVSLTSDQEQDLDAETVAADENTEKTITTYSALAQADIVFVIDTTGSMKEEIHNVKENIGYFVDALKKNGVSAELALVTYEDIDFDGSDSTRVHKNGDSNWFYDVESYKSRISGLALGCGGDLPECAVDALETARLLDMRASAGKIFILLTDAAYKTDNRYGIPSMAAEIELLKNAGVSCSVVSSEEQQSNYQELYGETEGIWVDINDDFHTELMNLADKIGNDIVGDGYWIYLQGPVPVPVRLDAVPQEGSKVDTDKDGIPDIEELESVTPTGSIDLDALLTQVSDGVITGTDYGTVMMYKYKSNPGETDTDFDGTDDSEDSAPNDSHGTGVMHYSVDETSYTCNIEFNMDYRSLICGDNETYTRDLSMLSVLLATDVYNTSYIEVTDFANTGGSDTGTNFGEMLGLEDSMYINIDAEDYAVDQDDITDFYVGHKNVIYNGEAHEVIVVSVRGTNGTHEEWSSNFDIGADTSEYYAATGVSHPDWVNKEHHKGFDVAATRVLNKLEEYIAENVSPYAEKSILITGHSRGAAIANILGKHFEEDEAYRSYTYTFASPNTTTASNAGNYTTIFNVVNTDDIITFIPLESWGFTKYGENKAVCVEDYYENEFGAEEEGCWEWFIGQDYNNDSSTQSTLNSFAKIASCREDMYILGETDSEKVWEDDLGHTTRAGAEEELATLSESLENEKLRKFCDMYIVYSFLIYHVEINYCPAYLLQTLANMTTGVGPLLGRDVAGVYADAKTAFVASSGKVLIGGMTHPHMPPTYYIMAYHDLKSLY